MTHKKSLKIFWVKSFNISTQGEGNAVLIKSGIPYQNTPTGLKVMHGLNPRKNGGLRETEKLCSGQTLLCKSLYLRVPEWDQKNFTREFFYIEDNEYYPEKIIETSRLGIPEHRDAHLPYRFIDGQYVAFCTKKPFNTTTFQCYSSFLIEGETECLYCQKNKWG